MEHRLILGGESYLPFARSRVKALKATGLSYASQQYEVDGVSIKVSIAPGHEFINIDGGCSMIMDSGVIDIRTMFPQNPLIYRPGVFVDTTRTVQYNAGYTQLTNDGKWKLKEGKTGQFSGKITGSGVRWEGRIAQPTNPLASFSPLKTIAEDGSVTYSSEDAELAEKNITVTKVPASNFTGRMRLYVQAMYGQGLYKYPQGEVTPRPAWWGYDLPGLLIPPGDRIEDGLPPGSATPANSSSGVYLDPAGDHWLMLVGSDTLYIMPLKGSSCAEASRKLIRSSSTTLNEQDKHHLETYILASCRPRTRETVAVPLGGTFNNVQMGYGWHWNWSGTCADIVENEEYFQGTYNQGFSARPNFAVESTHRRLTVTWSDDESGVRTWRAGVAEIEKSRWASLRNAWGVCYPIHVSTPVAGKTVPRWTELFESDAPFYVFYKDDVPQVCRIKVKKILAQDRRTNSVAYTPAPGSPLVEGDRPGFYDWVTDSNDWWSATISIGAEAYQMPDVGRGALGQYSKSTCAPSGDNPFSGYSGSFAFNTGFTINLGYPTAYTSFTGFAKILGGGAVYRQFITQKQSSVSDTYSGLGAAVVPFNDAEAIYLWSRGERARQHSAVIETVVNSVSCGSYTLTYTSEGGPLHAYLTYVFGPGGGSDTLVSTTSMASYTENTQLFLNQVLHCAAGVIQVEDMEGSMNDYLVPQLDEATPVFQVIASAKPGDDAAVFNTFSPPKNVEPFDKHFPVIVGWA